MDQRAEQEQAADGEEHTYDFPQPADVQFIPSGDPKLPPGMRITGVTPHILLNWKVSEGGELEESISYSEPPKGAAGARNAAKK
jgi:hypothetical protein